MWDGGLLFSKKKRFDAGSEGVQRGYLLERKWKEIPCRGAEEGKGSEPKVKNLVGGIWRQRVSEAERRVGKGV